MNISIEATTSDQLKEAERLLSQHGLLTNDSITLALMKHLGLTDLVTNDDDFDGVDWVTVWKPRAPCSNPPPISTPEAHSST